MSDITTIEPYGVPDQPKRGKRDRISPRIRRAVDALITGEAKTQQAAAQIAGLHPDHLSRMLGKPQIEVFYTRRTRELLGRSQMIAAARVTQLIHAESEATSLDAAKFSLAIAGIKPQADINTIINNNNTIAGYVVEIAGNDTPTTIDNNISASYGEPKE
jgi:hypothetical protein